MAGARLQVTFQVQSVYLACISLPIRCPPAGDLRDNAADADLPAGLVHGPPQGQDRQQPAQPQHHGLGTALPGGNWRSGRGPRRERLTPFLLLPFLTVTPAQLSVCLVLVRGPPVVCRCASCEAWCQGRCHTTSHNAMCCPGIVLQHEPPHSADMLPMSAKART